MQPSSTVGALNTHARWRHMHVSLEELIVALADKLWKGVRDSELEEGVKQPDTLGSISIMASTGNQRPSSMARAPAACTPRCASSAAHGTAVDWL